MADNLEIGKKITKKDEEFVAPETGDMTEVHNPEFQEENREVGKEELEKNKQEQEKKLQNMMEIILKLQQKTENKEEEIKK